jgi:hypothetical protein
MYHETVVQSVVKAYCKKTKSNKQKTTRKPDVLAHTCNPTYLGDRGLWSNIVLGYT